MQDLLHDWIGYRLLAHLKLLVEAVLLLSWLTDLLGLLLNLLRNLLWDLLLDLLHTVELLEVLSERILHVLLLLLLRHEVSLRHLIHRKLRHVHLLTLIRLGRVVLLHHLGAIRGGVLAHIELILHLVVHHHLSVRGDMALMELSVLLLEFARSSSILSILVIKVLVTLLDGIHNLTALVAKLHALLSIVIFIG